jgi:ABC-type transport system involved in Fe-S cluster assembly fused permease/ATPase subunit
VCAQAAEFLQLACLSLLNMAQSSVIFLGLASGLVVCVAGIARGALSVGHVVLFLTMMNQLYAPLNFFGSYYRQVDGCSGPWIDQMLLLTALHWLSIHSWQIAVLLR